MSFCSSVRANKEISRTLRHARRVAAAFATVKMSPRSRLPTPEICPVCGEDVAPRALACGECGADHNSGWRAEAEVDDALGEAADDFSYDDFVRSEFGTSPKPVGISLLWWLTALVLLLALGAFFLL